MVWRTLVAMVGVVGSFPLAPATADSAATAVGSTPVHSYADAVRETVWVQTTRDDDRNGVPDRVAVDVIRPREAAEAGVRVPVIMDVSPYYRGLGRGNEHEVKRFGPDGRPTTFPLFYDNFFVPRGYAVALVDSAGSGGSRGCFDVTGPSEVGAVVAVVDWLNGRAPAMDPFTGRPADATTWSTGKVGIIGKSYDGGLAIAAASRGVPEIATIVPIAAPTDYAELWRPGGAMAVGGIGPAFPPDCQPYTDEMEQAADFVTGNHNSFWAERDFVRRAATRDLARAGTSVFLVAGANDAVVPGSQFARWWEALGQAGVTRKLWLSGVGHVDPFDFRRAEWVRTLHRWFDRWLLGLDTGIEREPPVSVEPEPGRWVDERRWPAPGSRPTSWYLGDDGDLRRRPARPGATGRVTDDPTLAEAEAVADPTAGRDGRLVFLGEPLAEATRISGIPEVRLRFTADRPTTMVTARLVEYGPGSGYGIDHPGNGIATGSSQSCWGESVPADDACYFDTARVPLTAELDVLARGWVDAAHRASLTDPTPLQPGRWHHVRIPLDGEDGVVPAGHRLGLVVTLTDPTFEAPPPPGATLTVDLHRSRLVLPTVAPPPG